MNSISRESQMGFKAEALNDVSAPMYRPRWRDGIPEASRSMAPISGTFIAFNDRRMLSACFSLPTRFAMTPAIVSLYGVNDAYLINPKACAATLSDEVLASTMRRIGILRRSAILAQLDIPS